MSVPPATSRCLRARGPVPFPPEADRRLYRSSFSTCRSDAAPLHGRFSAAHPYRNTPWSRLQCRVPGLLVRRYPESFAANDPCYPEGLSQRLCPSVSRCLAPRNRWSRVNRFLLPQLRYLLDSIIKAGDLQVDSCVSNQFAIGERRNGRFTWPGF